jgi:glutaredoxin-related protein
MMHFTVIHWIMVVVFVLIFILLAVLSQKEQNKKTRLTLVGFSFIISVVGAVVSLLILDKYTKKAKIVNYTTQRNYNKESVTIRGSIKNTGRFRIGYCTMDIKIVNKVVHKKGTKFMYKTSSVGDMFKSRGYKKNFLKTSVRAIEDLKPRLSKKFSVSIKIPSSFQNPKYFLHLVCH